MHFTLQELTELSNKIDCFNYIQSPHFTNDPIPNLVHFSIYPPRQKTSNDKPDERIAATIKNFVLKSKNKAG
jgi:hypothetical protein